MRQPDRYPSPVRAMGSFHSLTPCASSSGTVVSLLGLKTGEIAKWLTPTGEECAAEIAAIQYQPEAAGDYSR